MQKTSFFLLSIVLCSGTTLAADLPRRQAAPVFTPVPVFSWAGLYFGGNAGYSLNVNRRRADTITITDPDIGTRGGSFRFGKSGQNGFTGGAQIGFNFQPTPGAGLVFGVEADAQYLDSGRRRSAVIANPGTVLNRNAVFFDPRATAGLDYFGTVRGRLGYAFDRTLVYATGGYAYGGGSANRAFGATDNAQMRTGWTVGGGVEYALPTDSGFNIFKSSAVTLKVEGLYVNLDRNRGNALVAVNPVTQDIFVVTPTRRSTGDGLGIIRAGVNYKFGI